MKKSIFALMIASVFAFSFMFVSCKKADEPKKDEAATEEVKDEAAAKADEKAGEKKGPGIVEKAIDAGAAAAKKNNPLK
jgi:hypothetical protein